MKELSSASVTASGTRVNLADIELALNRLWVALHPGGEAEQGVTRACMSNLIIACQTQEQARNVSERIPELVERHPARVFLLTACAPKGHSIEAEVSAHCRRTDGSNQLCSEHVDIRFDPAVAGRLGSVLRPLLIGDLPTALWWASNQPPPLSDGLFDTLAELADQVIYDSVGWPNPAEGVRAMTRWVMGGKRPAFNLAWRYLKPWRRILAQVLDPRVAPGALQNIDSIRIEHGPHALPMAWLLIGWLAARLQWKPQKGEVQSASEVGWAFRTPRGDMRAHIHRSSEGLAQVRKLNLTWQGAAPGRAGFLYGDDHRLSLLPEESTLPATSIPVREVPMEMMIAAQLAHRSKDPLFEQSIAVAQIMVGVLNKQADH
jgi:glucose-6-phosphate dehydrogenase assembly protein OpcA